MFTKSILTNLVLATAAILITLLALEAAVRISQYLRFSVSILAVDNRGPLVVDEKLGWRAMPNYVRDGTWRDAAGTSYRLRMSTDARGFRRFGDLQTARPKLFVVGDSYTHAIETSDGQTYFDVLGKSVPVELFVYGAGGFGTLQEYLLIDEYLDEIEPDMVLLQFCGNDFSNNSAVYEYVDLGNNNGLVRPYLDETGSVYYDLARSKKPLWQFANSYSRLTSAILFRLDNVLLEPPPASELSLIRAAAVDTTDQILGLLSVRVADVPMYAFATSSQPNVHDTFRDLSERHGIVFIDGVPQTLERAEADGLVGRVADGAHWSPAGHKIIAQPLIEFFTRELSRLP